MKYIVNKPMLFSLFICSVIVFITIIVLYEDNGVFTGTTSYDDGLTVVTTAKQLQGNKYRLIAYIEAPQKNIITMSCDGIIVDSDDGLLFKTDDIENHCLGTYSVTKISDDCYKIKSLRINSRKQTFFICEN